MNAHNDQWRLLERQAGPKALKLCDYSFSSDHTVIAHLLGQLPPLFWETSWADCRNATRDRLRTSVSEGDVEGFRTSLSLARGLLYNAECLKAEQALEAAAAQSIAVAVKSSDIDELQKALQTAYNVGLPEGESLRQASKKIVALRLRRLCSSRTDGATDLQALHQCLKVLRSYIANVAQSPGEDRYRHIRRSNRIFASTVAPHEEAIGLLQDCGFEMKEELLTLTSKPNLPLLWTVTDYLDVLLTKAGQAE